MFSYDNYCLKNELWEKIPGYENLYEASSLGRIRSIDRKITKTKLHGQRIWKGRILKNKTKIPSNSGYKVNLWKDGKIKDFLVSRLICMTFHGIPKNMENKNVKIKMTVNHKDGNRLNNKIENLEWLTISDNIKHGFENGLYPQTKILLTDKKTQKTKMFRSMAQASNYLNKNNGYVSGQLRRNQKIYDLNKNEYIASIVLT